MKTGNLKHLVWLDSTYSDRSSWHQKAKMTFRLFTFQKVNEPIMNGALF